MTTDGVTAQGDGTVAVTADSPIRLSGRKFKLFSAPTVTGDFSKTNWQVTGLDAFSLKASLTVHDDGVWLSIANGGTMMIFR